MAKDDRLELGRYLTNPFNEGGRAVRQLNFNDLFASSLQQVHPRGRLLALKQNI